MLLLGYLPDTAAAQGGMDPAAEDALAKTIADVTQSDRARLASAESLLRSASPKALDVIFKVIRDPATRAPVRGAFADTLTFASQHERVAKFAAMRLTDDKEVPEVRASAARLLGVHERSGNEALLRGYLQEPEARVRLAVLQGLLGLARAGSARVDLLRVVLDDREFPGAARSAAALSLGASQNRSVRPALAAVLSEDIAKLPEPTNLGAVLERANLLNGVVPVAAAQALGKLGDPEAAMDLLAVAQHPVPEMRIAIFESLARLKNPAALPAARQVLADDPIYSVRRWAAVLLKELRDPDAVPDLRRALAQDTDPGVRLQAVEALEAFGDRGAVPVIHTALVKEELKEVRAAMEHAINTLEEPGPDRKREN